MSYKIAIASGKGGTGKTTVSVNLYQYLSKYFFEKTLLVDCDVEEPNDLIFFSDAIQKEKIRIDQSIPVINTESCTFCRKCAEYCEFNAIVVIPPARFAEVNSSLCHSCGACLVACQHNAMEEHAELIGELSFFDLPYGSGLVEGKLKIGSAMQTLLIKELKRKIPKENDIILYDAPPGTSCPVVETVIDTDFVILVTEPTPFGFHDLKIMLELLRQIEKPFGVIINKVGLGNRDVYTYLVKEGIEILGEIPFKREYAASYAQGRMLEVIPGEIQKCYQQISENLERRIMEYEGNNHLKW